MSGREIVTSLQDVYGQSFVKWLYGKVYTEQKDWTLAEGYFQESLQLSQKYNFLLLYLQSFFELGCMYYAKRELDKALYSLDGALRGCEEKKFTWLARTFENALVQNYGKGVWNLLLWAKEHVSQESMQHLSGNA